MTGEEGAVGLSVGPGEAMVLQLALRGHLYHALGHASLWATVSHHHPCYLIAANPCNIYFLVLLLIMSRTSSMFRFDRAFLWVLSVGSDFRTTATSTKISSKNKAD